MSGAHAARLALDRPGPRRLLHALAGQAPWRFARRVLEVGGEVALAGLADALRGEGAAPALRAAEGGAPAATGGRRVALYAHYAASGQVSAMVQAQLAGYRALGFDVVFVTSAARPAPEGWAAAAAHCWRMLHRRNLGLDFGAWRDGAALLGPALPEELLLVNDSVIGPIHPLPPLLAAARGLGPGVTGLTESRQGGVHLQSYFLLAAGAAAVADTLGLLARLRLSRSKWLMVQRGEFGLTRHLLRRGHRVTALFGYDQALAAILADAEERRYLAGFAPWLSAGGDPGRWPLNPTTHLWRGLPRCLAFPFLKSSALRWNSRLPGIEAWPGLLGAGLLEPPMVRQHMSTLADPPLF